MRAVWKRELQAYFYTPIGYVFVGIFTFLFGLFFYLYNVTINFSAPNSDLSVMFGDILMLFIMMIIIPMLTMRLLSEERRNKTDQLLLTSPTSISGIVIGKFLAAATVLLAGIALSLFCVVVVSVYGTPSIASIFSSYLGFFLMISCYIAIGVLISSLCQNQLSALLFSAGINIVLFMLELLLPGVVVPNMDWLPKVFSWISLFARYNQFNAGVLSVANIVYFVSFIGVVLFLTIRVIDKRRWSEN